MNFIIKVIEKYLMPPMTKLSTQRHIMAVRDGIVGAMPFIIVGSTFLVIVALPLAPLMEGFKSMGWSGAASVTQVVINWLKSNAQTIILPFRISLGLISLYVAFGIGYNLARSYKIDPLAGGLMAFGAFMMTQLPIGIGGEIGNIIGKADLGQIGTKLNALGDKYGLVFPIEGLGAHDMFVAIIISLLAVEVLRYCRQRNLMIKMPDGVPESVARSFGMLIPVAIVIPVIWFFRHVMHIDFGYYIMLVFAPLVVAGSTLIGALVPVFLIDALWFCGIHGDSVVGAVARPLWTMMIEQNGAAVLAGLPAPNLFPEQCLQWFVWIGGSGCTLGLVVMMLFSKSAYLRDLGRVCIIPGIFNINEPVTFGLPIMYNPILMVPFIFGPLVIAVTTWMSMYLGWVQVPYILVAWTLPAPIGALLSTGFDWRALVLSAFNLCLMTAIYYPFFKAYERKLVAEETQTLNV